MCIRDRYKYEPAPIDTTLINNIINITGGCTVSPKIVKYMVKNNTHVADDIRNIPPLFFFKQAFPEGE